ncbi:hypothetical protein [Pseudoalteromonas sp. S16_S37]|uniref:hypothetical protein n=1 Tax=Pseudoalteromonas sp. S16_S37 TaxID=2720228 RepID=UPI001681B02F|nr:hypothetical protein [Pseudoalteromonas sp. S16_S37]MBD1584142.1 hypothetical protein [Pseudoalteromonas sp. S16_S37]
MNAQYLLKLFQLLATICLMWLLTGCQAKGIVNLQSGNILASQQWQNPNDSFTLPFVWHDGHIIIALKMNNSQPLRFALDSAASATVIFETSRTQATPLKIEGQLDLNGKQVNIVNNTRVELGNITLSDLTVVHVPLSQNPLFSDFDSAYFDGAIGYDLFNHYNITIHYADQLIVFSKPTTDVPMNKKDWQHYPIALHGRIPYLKANLSNQDNESNTYQFAIDTGAPNYIYLNEHLAQGFSFPNTTFPSHFENFDGVQQIETGRIKQFDLFGERFTQVSAHNLPKLEDEQGIGLVGSALLKNFDIHFNYQQGFVAIRKNKLFNTRSLLDRSGLVLEPHTQGGIVKQIASDSHATELRINEGSIITHINKQALTANNFDTLRNLLSSAKQSINLCWQTDKLQQCGDLKLFDRI